MQRSIKGDNPMKKPPIIASMAVIFILFTLCGSCVVDTIKTRQPYISSVPTDASDATDEPKAIEGPDDKPHAAYEDNPLLELARQGRVDGIEFGIGDKTKDIVEKWGKPDRKEWFLGGLYYRYDDKNVVFFTNEGSVGQDGNEIVNGDVVDIGIFGEDREVYNVRLGMTIEEITAILGEPTYTMTPEYNEDSELFYGWTYKYDVGEYIVYFQADTEDSPVDILYLMTNRE